MPEIYVVVVPRRNGNRIFGLSEDEFTDCISSAEVEQDTATLLHHLRETRGIVDVEGDEGSLEIIAFGYREDPHMAEAFEDELRRGNHPLLVEARPARVEVTLD